MEGKLVVKVIRIAAALIARENGDVLLVRKRGSAVFMQPGGKIDAGETPISALVRELDEEIGLQTQEDRLEPLGTFEALAANEPDHRVIADLFLLARPAGPIAPRAEIEEIRWIDPHNPGDLPMAALTADHILPFWRQRLAGT